MGACVLRYCIIAHLEKWSKISTNFPRKDRDLRASFFGGMVGLFFFFLSSGENTEQP